MSEWLINDAEWERLGRILTSPPRGKRGRGRPRADNDRAAAQACLYHYFHSLSGHYHCFGWNELPSAFGVSPSTANRRFREWTASGSWSRFWDALMAFRREREQRKDTWPKPPRRRRVSDALSPVSGILEELGRAYTFFNASFFGGSLPTEIAITLETMVIRYRGFFCGQAWQLASRRIDQITISTVEFGEGPWRPLGTLLHEMVHCRNHSLGLVDCGASGYHNAHFRDAALLAGLECEYVDRYRGYARTQLAERGREAIVRLKPSEEAFRWIVGRQRPWR